MSFFTRVCLCVSLLIPAQLAWAQSNTYYWSGDQKISLSPNKGSLVVFLKDAQPAASVFTLSNRDLRAVRDTDRPAQTYWVADLNRTDFTDPAVAVRSLVKEPEHIAGASFGLRINGGMPVWLTKKILLEPNAAFDATRMQAVLRQFEAPDWQRTVTGTYFIELSDPERVIPLANALYETGMFHYAHPDFLVRSHAANAYDPPTDTCHVIDPYYDFQYYLYNCCNAVLSTYPYSSTRIDIDIDAPEAWCITRGDAGITIAVIDEGVQYHEDLLDTLGVSRVLPGYTPADTNGVGRPEISTDAHGQAVSGIIAASHNNEGLAGVAPNVKILPVQIFTDGTAPLLDFVKAIDWAWQNGADVINNSWVFDTCGTNLLPAMENAINRARTLGRGGLGTPVVFSSGSIVSGQSCVGYPASIPEVLTVGVINSRGNRPNYARYGNELDLVGVSAPGNVANLTVIDLPGDSGYNYAAVPYDEHADVNYSKWFGGTSAAAAQASGILGLMLSENAALTEQQLITMIKASVDSMGAPNIYGEGRLNAYQAVLEVATTFPVEWMDISAEQVSNGIEINWFTATEQNNDYFSVERLNGSLFEPLGRVEGVGNSQAVQAYQFTDITPRTGQQVYRVRQVDIDGQFSFSPSVALTVSQTTAFRIFPNPVNDQLMVRFGPDQQRGQISLMDMQGRLIKKSWLTLEGGAASWDVSQVKPGLYLVVLEALDLERAVMRLVVQ